MSPLPHRLAAVWFADLSGFSGWASRDEDQALQLVALFQRTCEQMVERFGGRVVKFLGDGALAEFSSTEAAVKAACCLTHAFPVIAEGEGLAGAQVHVGIHVGEVASGPDGDLYGEGVNMASRLEGLGGGSQVLASPDVRNQLHHRAEFEFESLGERSIEGMDRSIPVYAASFLRVGEWEAMGDSPARVRRRAWRDRLARHALSLGLAGILLLAGLGIVLAIRYLPLGESSGVTPQFHDDRVAVLYFEDFTPDGHLGFLVDGLTETLIHELAEVSGIEVVSRNGVKPYAGTDVGVDSIARALGARTLVQGSVAESGEVLRVNVQLIDGPSGTVLQSEQLERTRGELFALQDDLGRHVSEVLRRRLGEQVRLREFEATGSRNVEAWELVQRARAIRKEAIPVLESGDTGVIRIQLARADSLLARAESVDPGWVEPVVERTQLALDIALGLFRASLEGTEVEIRRWIDTGLNHAQRALERDPDNPGALEQRGTLRFLWWFAVEPDMEEDRASQLLSEVEGDLRAAIERAPNRASAHSILAHVLSARGAPVEAYQEARRAYETDAYLEEPETALWRLFYTAYDLSLDEEAARWCEEGHQRFVRNPRFIQCQIWLASMPEASADPIEVWALYRDHQELLPAEPKNYQDRSVLMGVAAALARAGLADSAQAVARRARADEIDPARDLANMEAFVNTLAGNEQQAVRHLSEYLEATPGQRSEVATTWWFRDLRDVPAFRRLVEPETP